MSEEMKSCPQCECPYAYMQTAELYVCPECNHEWNPEELAKEGELVVKDSIGTLLQKGDSVIVIKNLPVRGAPGPIKKGTKVKNIRLSDGEHNINCKIEGFGQVSLKSEFVRKA